MKNFCLFTLFLYGMLIIPVNAQSPNGYDAVAWGASISEILRAYPEMVLHKKAIIAFDLHNLQKDFSEVIRCYVESGVNAPIKSRSFYFYQERLFCVSVDYTPEGMSWQTLRPGLENIYGTFADFPPETKKYPMGDHDDTYRLL